MKIACNICKRKVHAHKPSLFCNKCSTVSHFQCNDISKSQCISLIQNKSPWTCTKCIPSNPTLEKPKPFSKQCSSCDTKVGPRYAICQWCDSPCHIKKCYRGELGCEACARSMIPSLDYEAYQLNDDYLPANNVRYNPHENLECITDINSQEGRFWNTYSNTLQNCTYVKPNKICESSKSNINVYSQNIRSLTKNIEPLRENHKTYSKFDILCFNETGCDPENCPFGITDLELDGFHPPILQKPCRSNRKGGGLAIYVNKHTCGPHDFKIKENLCQCDTPAKGEFLAVELSVKKAVHRNFIILCTYRSPSSTPKNYLESLRRKLQILGPQSKKPVILAGDLNIDLLKIENDSFAQELSDTMLSHGLSQTISRPTRITSHSATLIDHIYTNSIQHVTSSGILLSDLSDHLGTFTKLNFESRRVETNYRVSADTPLTQFRLCRQENLDHFVELVSHETWQDALDSESAEAMFTKLDQTYLKHYDEAFPLKTSAPRRKNERQNPKPWMMDWLEDAIARKDELFKKFVKNNCPETEEPYLNMLKFTQKHCTLAKNRYYTRYFEQYNSDSRMQWRMINSLLHRSKKSTGSFRLKLSNGNITSDSKDIANAFNDWFINIPVTIKEQIQQNSNFDSSHDPLSFLGPSNPNSMHFEHIDTTELKDIINSLDSSKATSDTKTLALKSLVNNELFLQTLSSTINASFEQGIVPAELKVAKVVPIHKSGSRNECSNYRPISLLPTFSKLYERAAHKRLMSFMEHDGKLYDAQFGFRKQHSCEHALLSAQEHIVKSLDRKQITLLLLIDFSKAFDLVQADIMIRKLENYGIRGTVLEWFASYLTDRFQSVQIHGVPSEKKKLAFGVPQGSILGPLLFLIYVNDLPGIDALVKFIAYADDCNILITGDNAHEVITKFENLISKLSLWVSANGLKLNVSKTNYMIFSNINNGELDQYCPQMNGQPITRVPVARFLGIMIDEKLSWAVHIEKLNSKMSRNLGILRSLKKTLPKKALLTLYHSFIQSHLNFCSIIWGLGSKNSLKKLFVTQKKAVRMITPGFVNYYYDPETGEPPAHTKQLFADLKIPTVYTVVLKNLMIFMYKSYCFNISLPQYIRNLTGDYLECLDTDPLISDRLITSKYFSLIKGPRLYRNIMKEAESSEHRISTESLNRFKAGLMRYVMYLQSVGPSEDWGPDNFRICQTKPQRKSPRLNSEISTSDATNPADE